MLGEGEIEALEQEQILIEDQSYTNSESFPTERPFLDLSETDLTSLRNLFLHIPLCISHPISHSQNNLKSGISHSYPGIFITLSGTGDAHVSRCT